MTITFTKDRHEADYYNELGHAANLVSRVCNIPLVKRRHCDIPLVSVYFSDLEKAVAKLREAGNTVTVVK